MERLRNLLKQHQSVIQRYHVQYLSRFDAQVLGNVIQVWKQHRTEVSGMMYGGLEQDSMNRLCPKEIEKIGWEKVRL